MDIVTISSKDELVRHEGGIETLFLECFGDSLSLELWRWAYIDNPNGDPVVSLCYDRSRLVGHYAAIPMPIKSSSKQYNSYLSMTTMVAASHRQHGLFVKLAENTYRLGRELDIDFVMGFPNSMSTPGFRKRLNWTLPASDFVATVGKSQLLECVSTGVLADREGYKLDLENERTRTWRLSRPGAVYEWNHGLAYKGFGEAVDLLAYGSVEDLIYLPDDKMINLLLPAEAKAFVPFKAFDYQFGGISLKSQFEPERIIRQMALSDLF